MRKLLFILLAIMVSVSVVNAWTIKSDRYVGTVHLYGDGTGVANVNGHGDLKFTWNLVEGNRYEAHYWWYTIPFEYNAETDTITSSVTDAVLVR
jgi:hypothetical protein